MIWATSRTFLWTRTNKTENSDDEIESEVSEPYIGLKDPPSESMKIP